MLNMMIYIKFGGGQRIKTEQKRKEVTTDGDKSLLV